MLYSVDSGKYVDKLPHKDSFDAWMKKLPADKYEKIVDALSARIDLSDINTSSWIPGKEWAIVYEPLNKACQGNKEAAGHFFGLILFDLLMRRPEAVWGFGRFEKNGLPLPGTTYFILQNPPPRI